MKRLLAIALLGLASLVNAQTQSTPNLITSGTGHTWTGVSTGALPACCSGGPGALYDPATDTIHFSYGQSTVAQTFAINQALRNAGAGIQVQGYSYSWDIRNLNGDNRQGGTDTLTASVITYNADNTTVRRTDSWTYNTKFDWTTYSGDIAYINPGLPSDFGNLKVQFSGKDSGFWAGYFGPQVRNVSLRMNYGVDACAADPLSSTACPGYAAAYQTQQCTANPLYSTSCPGYQVAYQTQQCAANPLYSTSCPGYAAAYETQQCSINPLYSSACSGYQVAYHDQQCSINPLYATDCTGYQSAYLQQQCSANPLYSTSCSGYQTAYHDQQCSINTLYATDCPGYASAYLLQQCTANPLYSTTCAGYAVAYKAQQCNLNGLYDRTCPNYSEAYAKKQLLETPVTTTVIAQATVTATVSTEGTVTTTPSATGNSTVDKAITPTTTTANSAASPAAPVQLVAPAPAADAKKEAPQQNASLNSNTPGADTKPSGQPKSNREALQERRREAAQKEAVAKGKDLANTMGKAADMEAQKQIQNVVIQAMGYSPGFDSYKQTAIPDTAFYKPFTVYNNQKNVDNRANLRMFGGTDRLHNEMIELQYQMGR